MQEQTDDFFFFGKKAKKERETSRRFEGKKRKQVGTFRKNVGLFLIKTILIHTLYIYI